MQTGISRKLVHTMGAVVRISICAAILLPTACEKKSSFTPPPPKVTVSQPVRENITDHLEFTGNTQAVNIVQLRARVEGYLDKVFFKDGELVKKDQLLFLLQQNTYIARLQQAEGNILTQKALLDHAQTEFARYSNLLGQKAAAQTDVENWRYQKDSAQAALMAAEAQRDLAKLDFGYTWVTAPFAGRIDRRIVDPGNLVGSGTATVLAELTQIDPLYVYFNISESQISPITRGGEVVSGSGKSSGYPVHLSVAGEEGFPHEGQMDFTATTVNTGTGTLLVRAVFPNSDGKILPGQFARIRILLGREKSAILVPKVAVGMDQQGSYVMIVNGKNIVERRAVKTGFSKADMYVIEEGLSGDERVIVNGMLKAIPGKPVTPMRETASGLVPEKEPANATESKVAK